MSSTPYAERIHSKRLEHAWSQEQLATIAGTSTRTVQRIESGQPATFDSLKAIASAFGIDVSELMMADPSTESATTLGMPVSFLARIKTGTELFRIVGGSNAFLFDQDELDNPEEVEMVASFLQEVHDYGDIWPSIEIGERVRVANQFTRRIKDLEGLGHCVFGMLQDRPLSEENRFMLRVAVICVTRPANPSIVHLEQAGEVLPTSMRPLKPTQKA